MKFVRCGVTDVCTDVIKNPAHRLELNLGGSGQKIDVLVCPYHFQLVTDGIRDRQLVVYTIRATA